MRYTISKGWLTVMRLLLFMAPFYACSKKGERPREFQVAEWGTRKALEGVKVEGYKCLEHDWIGWCTNEQFSGVATSNSAGIASFPSSADVGVIRVSKDKYWSNVNYFTIGSDPVTYLYPVATLRVHLVKVNAHSPADRLYVYVQQGPYWDMNVVRVYMGQPADTTLYLKGRGNYDNDVHWDILNGSNYVAGGTTPRVTPQGFDTAALDIRY